MWYAKPGRIILPDRSYGNWIKTAALVLWTGIERNRLNTRFDDLLHSMCPDMIYDECDALDTLAYRSFKNSPS